MPPLNDHVGSCISHALSKHNLHILLDDITIIFSLIIAAFEFSNGALICLHDNYYCKFLEGL